MNSPNYLFSLRICLSYEPTLKDTINLHELASLILMSVRARQRTQRALEQCGDFFAVVRCKTIFFEHKSINRNSIRMTKASRSRPTLFAFQLKSSIGLCWPWMAVRRANFSWPASGKHYATTLGKPPLLSRAIFVVLFILETDDTIKNQIYQSEII